MDVVKVEFLWSAQIKSKYSGVSKEAHQFSHFTGHFWFVTKDGVPL